MKKHVYLWLVMFLAVSLVLPIYSMAQTTLTLESYTTGDRISGGTIKSFSMGPDNNLVVYLDGPFNFADLAVPIWIQTSAPCSSTVPSPYPPPSVTAIVGSNINFVVCSLSAAAAPLSMVVDPAPGVTTVNGAVPAIDPIPTFSSPMTIAWNTAGVPTGSYLAVFQASADPLTSQLVVMIRINPATPTSTLQVNSSDSGVAITVSPADNSSQGSGNAPFSRTYNQNTPVTLTAPATYNGKNFSGWTGADSTGGYWATVTMPSSGTKTVTVNYSAIPTSTLQVNSSDSGVGITVNVADNSGQSNGNAPFSRTYNQNTPVTLTAPATYNGKNFSSWTGADSTGGYWATVTMPSSGTKTVTVNYTQPGSNTPCQPGDLTAPMPWSIKGPGTWNFCLPEGKLGIMVRAIGLSDTTYGALTWTFPDGTVFPRNPEDGQLIGQGTRSVNLRIYNQIPGGHHVLTITGSFSGYVSADF